MYYTQYSHIYSIDSGRRRSDAYFDKNVTKLLGMNIVILSKDAKTFKNLIIEEF